MMPASKGRIGTVVYLKVGNALFIGRASCGSQVRRGAGHF